MNRNAAIATFLAVGTALLAYFIMRFVPRVEPPHRVFFDSVSTKIEGGKEKADTIWSRVPDFEFTNQFGQKIGWKDLKGKVVVADFFFTTCPTICPQMTRHMKQLQDAIKPQRKVNESDSSFVQFISFTVDPEHDDVAALKRYADRFQINPQNWWLLTGPKKEIYDLALKGMKLGISSDSITPQFIHPQKFILIDKDRVIRARKDSFGNIRFCNGMDSNEVRDLAEDIVFLSLEKDPHKKFFLSGKLELIAVVFVIAAILIVLLFAFLKKENKNARKS